MGDRKNQALLTALLSFFVVYESSHSFLDNNEQKMSLANRKTEHLPETNHEINTSILKAVSGFEGTTVVFTPLPQTIYAVSVPGEGVVEASISLPLHRWFQDGRIATVNQPTATTWQN